MMVFQDFRHSLQSETMSREIWKEVPGHPNLFVSSLGRLRRNYKHGKEHLIKGRLNTHGYRVTTLYANGKHQQFHRLVAITFIPNPEGKPFIDHINGNRDDNRVENLRWCTNKENMNYSLARKHLSEAMLIKAPEVVSKRTANNRCNAEKEVCQLSLDGELLRVYLSISKAAEAIGGKKYNPKITAVCKEHPQRKSAYGFRWCYYYGCNLGIISLLL